MFPLPSAAWLDRNSPVPKPFPGQPHSIWPRRNLCAWRNAPAATRRESERQWSRSRTNDRPKTLITDARRAHPRFGWRERVYFWGVSYPAAIGLVRIEDPQAGARHPTLAVVLKRYRVKPLIICHSLRTFLDFHGPSFRSSRLIFGPSVPHRPANLAVPPYSWSSDEDVGVPRCAARPWTSFSSGIAGVGRRSTS